MPPLWALHAIPFFLCGLILMYLLAFQLQWLPMFGGYTAGAFPGFTLAFIGDVLQHAILPTLSGGETFVVSLALALGQILSGAVLVEVIFAYPGIGTVLFHAIRENDHFLIQGIVFSVIVALGVATLLLDVLYPWLDPRITYRRA